MKTKFLLFLVLFSVTCTINAGGLKSYSGATPVLALNDINGEPHSLEDYQGKVVLVQFWATYCTPCRKEMPSMNRLQEILGEDFVILAINMGETPAEVEKFIQEVGPEFTVLMDNDGQALGSWKVFAAPSNFVVDREGKIRYTLYGGVEWDSEEIIAELEAL